MRRCEYRQCDAPATVLLSIEERIYPPSEGEGDDQPFAITNLKYCEEHRDVMLSRRDDEDEVGDGL